MKKSLFLAALCAAFLMAFTACSKDEEILTFSFENPASQDKVYLSEGGLPIFHDHDSLRVNTDGNLSIHYTTEGLAYLNISELSASNTYPYIAVLGPQAGCQIGSDGTVTGWANVASEYNFCRAETFDGTNVLKEKVYAPMMGYIPNEAAGRNFCMKNLCGILRFSLKASTSQYLRVQKINITSEGSDIAGRVTCTWNTSTNMPGTIQLSDQAGQHSNSIQVNNINCPLHSDYVTVCNIPIAPVTQACKLYITITVNDVSNLKTYTYTRTQTSNIFTIGRNELITLQTDLDNGWTRQEFCTYQPQPAAHYFKVGDNKYIEFAPANLQYSPLNRVYRFAPHQYDFLGRANENVSSTYAGWIDLFGFHAGNNANYATDNVITDWTNNNQYHGAYIQYFFNCEDGYRTPTGDELTQVINDSRMTGSWTLAWVRARITDGTQVLANGLILFPDNFVCPTGIPSLTRNANDYIINSLSLTDWATLEQAGCVFLPAGGYRKGQSAYEYENGIPYGARYGSCTHQSNNNNSDNATYLIFNKSSCNTEASNKYIGRSIRLVRDCTVASSSN